MIKTAEDIFNKSLLLCKNTMGFDDNLEATMQTLRREKWIKADKVKKTIEKVFSIKPLEKRRWKAHKLKAQLLKELGLKNE